MAKITTKQKLDNIRNMKAMIHDYSELHNRYPTNKEMGEKLVMSERTVKRYRAFIFNEIKKELKESFHDDIILCASKIIEKINKSIITFVDIRDSKDAKESDRINAAREVILAEQYKLKVMHDGIIFMDGDDDNNEVRDNKQHIHRPTESDERTQESFESMFS